MAESEEPDAQWPVILDQKCELCEINSIKYKCLNCDEMICNNCTKTHLKSKAAKDHKVVCLRSAEIYNNNQMLKKCQSHEKEDLLMYCNTCNCPVCRECVTSGVHLHHPMIKVEEAIDSKQKQLSSIIKQTNEKSKKYKDVIQTIVQNKLEFSMSIAMKIKEVKAKNNELKSRLDKIEADYIIKLQHIDKENKKSMTELEQKLQEEMSDLNQLIQQCERTQRNRNIEMVKFVIDVTQTLDKYRPCDPPDKVSPPDLKTRHVDDEELKDLFGQLDMRTTPTVNTPIPMPRRNIPSAGPAIDAKIHSSFSSKQTHLVTTGNDQAWLWSLGCRGIYLVSPDNVIQAINTDFDVHDAAVSTSGDLLVTVYMGDKVKKLTRNKTFIDICTAAYGYTTKVITVTNTGNVLVVLYKYKDSKIVEITTNGQQIRTIQQDTVKNTLMFDNPWDICSNINGDIVVIDSDKVVVFNQQEQMKFIYQAEGRTLMKPFDAFGVVTDKYGHIIISDYNNSLVHVLDKDGKFVQYLLTPSEWCSRPMGLAIDNSGRLWVCNEKNKKILIVKYL